MRPATRSIRVLVPLLLVLLATLAGWQLEFLLGVAGQMLLYLLVAVWVAFFLGRMASAYAAALSVAAFSFFFLEPRHSFHVADRNAWLALCGLLLVSFTVATLAEHLRQQRFRAERRADRSRQAHALAESLGMLSSVDSIAGAGLQAIHGAFAAPVALALRGADGTVSIVAVNPAKDAGLFDPHAARWCVEYSRRMGPGTLDWPELRCWGVPLAAPAGAFGAVLLALDQERREVQVPEDLGHLETLARQVGLAIQRERAQQASLDSLRAAEVQAVRNALLASISHDMRAPLAVIVGAASTLLEQRDDLAPADRAKLLQGILDEARRMTRTTENVLSLARLSAIDAGNALRTDWESVEEIVGAAVATLRQRAPGLVLSVQVEPELPLLRVNGGLLAQALDNLLDNAWRHGGGKPVALRAARERAADGDRVVLTVRDQGPGLPPGIDPARLFEPFVRGTKPASSAGHGLGLAICRHIAALHGGTISAGNAAGGGAEFRLSLPVSRRDERPAEAAP